MGAPLAPSMQGVYLREAFASPPGTPAPWVQDIAIPDVAPGFILVKVHAASINPVDKIIAAGAFAERSPIGGEPGIFKLPRSVGCDFSGVVSKVGEGAEVTVLNEDGSVTSRPAEVGDAVFGDGIVGTGTFCQYASVCAKQAVVKPESLTDADAASIPLAGLTAYQAMTHTASMSPEGAMPVGPGSKVLVLGGSGGVGSLAIQIAKALGATVAATSSDVQLLASLGCDIPINYREEDWGEKLKGEDYDFIFATVDDSKPSPASERALGVLKADGCFICLLPTILPSPLPEDGRKWAFILTQSMVGPDLALLLQWIKQGKLKPILHEGKTSPSRLKGGQA